MELLREDRKSRSALYVLLLMLRKKLRAHIDEEELATVFDARLTGKPQEPQLYALISEHELESTMLEVILQRLRFEPTEEVYLAIERFINRMEAHLAAGRRRDILIQ